MDNNENQELVFHYNREHRLENAPQRVKDFYAGNMKRIPTNPIKILTQNRASKLCLIILLFALASGFFVDSLREGKHSMKVDKTKIEFTSFVFGDEAFANLSFSEVKDYNKSVPLFVEFTTFDKDGNQLAQKQGTGLYNGQKTSVALKFTNFEIHKIVAKFEYLGKEYTLKSTLK